MKRLAMAFFAVSLSSCGFIKTNEVSTNAGVQVPSDRVLTNQFAEAGTVKFTIARDTGYLGGGCFIAVEIDRNLAARFDTGEVASFYVKPGKVELSVLSDPLGRGLCGAVGFVPVREIYDFRPDSSIRFRLSSRQYRRPELESNDIEPFEENAKVAAVTSIAGQSVAAVPLPVTSDASSQSAGLSQSSQPTVAIAQPSSVGEGLSKQRKYQYSAEIFAKNRQCTPLPLARLVASSAGSETYSIPCSTNEVLIVRCDFGNCRALQ